MAGGNTLGGATGAISRTALDYAPFELPENDPSFTNENKTNVFSWLNDYVDLTDDKTFKASLNLNWKINKFSLIVFVQVVISIRMIANDGMECNCIKE